MHDLSVQLTRMYKKRVKQKRKRSFIDEMRQGLCNFWWAQKYPCGNANVRYMTQMHNEVLLISKQITSMNITAAVT